MEGQKGACFDCLQRRVEADFSCRLTFVHGLSDSLLPCGSEAVVQVSGSGSQQFVLNYVPYDEDSCLARYIDEYLALEGGDIASSGQAEVNLRLPCDKSSDFDTTSHETQFSPVRRTSLLMGCEKCSVFSRFSCSRIITSLAPVAAIGTASYDLFKELSLHFSSGSLEDHILQSLIQFTAGKYAGRDSINFLGLIGFPSFEENSVPGCIRHPNILPVLALLKSSGQVCMVLPKKRYSLQNILHYAPQFIKSDWRIQLLIYQILSALSYMHGLGVAHENLLPSKIMVSNTCWCWIRIDEKLMVNSKENPCENFHSISASNFCSDGCFSHALCPDLRFSESENWNSSFYSWWKGEISNFDYLLVLNKLAGRRWGDNTFYTVMPWVIDFSVKPDEKSDAGWRDLTKSKWRLTKGDEQLDFTYSTSETPHHVSEECLSELAVCSYKARRLPLHVLQAAVRSVYEPNEYPSSMQRLYQWTPDECIPEFFCDPRIYQSLHPGMPDLALPSWSVSSEEFVRLHRNALESNRVSSQLHHWIDITFGYKMSGDAAIASKNVMLPASNSSLPRSTGRRQLFVHPHPARQVVKRGSQEIKNSQTEVNYSEAKDASETNYLGRLEETISFCQTSCHLAPEYIFGKSESSNIIPDENFSARDTSESASLQDYNSLGRLAQSPFIGTHHLLEKLLVGHNDSPGNAELLLWNQTYSSRALTKETASDIFAVGCILAEIQLGRPLFDSYSFSSYMENGVPPRSLQDLPYCIKIFVEACIQKEWNMRPSAKCLLDSPFFQKFIRSSYLFLAPFHLLAKDESRLYYAGTIANQGALKSMGALADAICLPFCLPLLEASVSDSEVELAYLLLTEFLKCLELEVVKNLLLPSVQKILQSTSSLHLKVSLLQDSFMRLIWNKIGLKAYLVLVHPIIVSNLCGDTCKTSATAASVLLIGSSEELGVPITVQQTIMPLMLSFGRGLCDEGFYVVTRIGGLFGEQFVVRQILPLINNIISSCLHTSHFHKHESAYSWSTLALKDCLRILDGLCPVLASGTIIKELIEGERCPYIIVLMNKDLEGSVLQDAARSLLTVCHQIGSSSTLLHVLPKLKEFFHEIAFTKKDGMSCEAFVEGLMIYQPKVHEEFHSESHMDLVLILYPELASLLGIERLRQCCATWLLLEQFLLRRHNWKWEYADVSNKSGPVSENRRRQSHLKRSTSEDAPANILQSSPQLKEQKISTSILLNKNMIGQHPNPMEFHGANEKSEMQEPWYWFPRADACWNWLDIIGQTGTPKNELPWKIRASIVHSIRTHHRALRSIAVCEDECTIFTAGAGPGFKGSIQKLALARVACVSSYNGHDEVVNDICILGSSGRVASCDGTLHIWNEQNGRLISAFSESPIPVRRFLDSDENLLDINQLSSGILNASFHGNSFTTMDYMEFNSRLVVGTGNGSLRFIDVNQGQKLHLWRSDLLESGFAPLISSVCSSSSLKMVNEQNFPSSLIAVGYSSGHCKLFDMKSGKIIASWKAHDGYVTKLAAASYQLISSSLDKTLRVWDLRRNWTSENTVFRGYADGVRCFSVRGDNIMSVCRNKISLSSLHGLTDQEGQRHVSLQHLYTADGESKNTSLLSAVNILPFSHLFLVGTEDGYLKICC